MILGCLGLGHKSGTTDAHDAVLLGPKEANQGQMMLMMLGCLDLSRQAKGS